MEEQRYEGDKLEEILERRRRKFLASGSQLVAHERMSQYERSKDWKEKAKRWSTEEMKNSPEDMIG